MNIALIYRQDVRRNQPVLCYPRCYGDVLRHLGHQVFEIGEGHDLATWEAAQQYLSDIDLILEIENGRNASGKLEFQGPEIQTNAPKAVVLIDSHGHPDLHQLVAKGYDHVFFAVWARRDLFAEHPSAHWCPNATDLRYFGHENFKTEIEYDVAFYSSKMGLSRALMLEDVCRKNGWTFDIRECVKPRRNRWPMTGEAMSKARILFNRGQKHDSPNQRVMESMAGMRPLICDRDAASGMDKLFVEGRDYLAYNPGDSDELEECMRTLLENPKKAQTIAYEGYLNVSANHTVTNRVNQILEVVNL